MTITDRPMQSTRQVQDLHRYEEALRKTGASLIAGVDEVGRGPLAGPVTAAAVILPLDFDAEGIDDSKKLTPRRREMLAERIRKHAVAWSIGWCDNAVIDDINILQATKRAMTLAINGLSVRPEHVLIDALSLPELAIPQTAIVKGDSRSVSIAAASILAKVARDEKMQDYDTLYPGYAFGSNKGYGTKAHYDGLDALGPCPVHRRSFLHNYFAGGNAWNKGL